MYQSLSSAAETISVQIPEAVTQPAALDLPRNFDLKKSKRKRTTGKIRYLRIAPKYSVPSDTDAFAYRLFKSTFDVCGATALLLCSLPSMLLIAAAIKLTSRGPLIFKQT